MSREKLLETRLLLPWFVSSPHTVAGAAVALLVVRLGDIVSNCCVLFSPRGGCVKTDAPLMVQVVRCGHEKLGRRSLERSGFVRGSIHREPHRAVRGWAGGRRWAVAPHRHGLPSTSGGEASPVPVFLHFVQCGSSFARPLCSIGVLRSEPCSSG